MPITEIEKPGWKIDPGVREEVRNKKFCWIWLPDVQQDMFRRGVDVQEWNSEET